MDDIPYFPGMSPGRGSLCPSGRPVSGLCQLVGGAHHHSLQRPPGDGGLEEGGGLLRLHRLGLLPAAPAGWGSHLHRLRAEGEAPSTSAAPPRAQQQCGSVQRHLYPPNHAEVGPRQVKQLQDEPGGAVGAANLQLPEKSPKCVQGLQSVSVDTTRQLQILISETHKPLNFF